MCAWHLAMIMPEKRILAVFIEMTKRGLVFTPTN